MSRYSNQIRREHQCLSYVVADIYTQLNNDPFREFILEGEANIRSQYVKGKRKY